MCGVGKFRQRWKLDPVNQCHRCSQAEDHLHVPRCPAPSAQLMWNDQIQALTTWLHGQHTAPAIITVIIGMLQQVQGGPPVSTTSISADSISSSRAFQQALASQTTIGPQGTLEGNVSKHWAALQQQYLTSKHSRRSGKIWAARLVQQLLMIGFTMWEHRNEFQHSDLNPKLQKLSHDINQGIRDQFHMGSSGLPGHICPYLQSPLSSVLNRPLLARQEWLRLVRQERALFRRPKHRQTRITSWRHN